MELPHPPLLLVTDRKQARAPLDDILNAAFAAGCRWASLREKDLGEEEQLALAKRLLAITRRWDASLTLHGDPGLARRAGLDGVHLAAGGNAAAARELLGSGALVGISLHGADEAAALEAGVVDYAIAGPAYATESKPGYGPALGRMGIQEIARATAVPVLAIGGVVPENVTEMRAAGAVGIAVMGSIMRAPDPASEVKRFAAALEREVV
jgi:thiamine-phosphate pyrophosphorylase